MIACYTAQCSICTGLLFFHDIANAYHCVYEF
jgi:hypothetical protein